MEVDEQAFANVSTVKHFEIGSYGFVNRKIKFLDSDEFRFIAEGDTLVLTSNGKYSAFSILKVERDRGLSSEELNEYY